MKNILYGVLVLLIINFIIMSITMYIKAKKFNKYKRLILSFKVGERPILPIFIELPYPYITIERKGMIIFIYNTGKQFNNSIERNKCILKTLNEIEKERLCLF